MAPRRDDGLLAILGFIGQSAFQRCDQAGVPTWSSAFERSSIPSKKVSKSGMSVGICPSLRASMASMTACRTLARLGLNRPGMSGDRKLQAVQLAGRDHADQRRLGPLATLEQPLGEVGPRAESGDRDVDGAGPGVPVPVAVGEVTRSGELVPYSAPQTASASADINALITVVSRSHIRSGDAADRPLSSSWAGLRICGAVIVMVLSRVL